MAFPVTLNGTTYTLANFEGLNYVEGFPDALEDFVTEAAAKVTAAELAETNAETAETNAAASASAAASSASAAAASATSAAASLDAIEGFYLGAQASDPTLDLNGDALTAGDWYFNTGSSALKVYDGSTFITFSALTFDVVDDTTPQLGGNLDGAGYNISGVTDLTITGDLTVDTSTLVVDSTNNRVGIGETSPSYLLDLKGGTNDSIRLNALSGRFIFANGSGADKGSLSMNGGNMDIAADAGIDFYPGGSPLSGDPQVTLDSSGNVGIGTNSPSKPLELALLKAQRWQTGSTTLDLTPTAGAIDSFIFNTSQAAIYDWAMAGTVRMRLESDYDLHVDGDVVAYSTTVSDASLKDDVETIDSALSKVSNLRGVTYTWNKGSREGKRDLGVIAQEVETVIPEIVHEKQMALIDGETYKTVDYEKLTAVLIEAVKELKAEVDSLKAAR